MLKRVARGFLPHGEAFEEYYRNILTAAREVAPRADEARRDYLEAMRVRRELL